ncbi:YecR family lipoprotein [Methylovulum sp.]|uniref:YecR family lipoprotein n=1 Tax=Methylovulum sp. TaxID=1916980 RepID=UPI0034308585
MQFKSNSSQQGGSRSDGTVKLSFEYGMFEVPKLDEQQGLSVAKQRCAAWGYTGTEPFGGSTKTCTSSSNSGCNRWLVTVEYQCTGSSPASN